MNAKTLVSIVISHRNFNQIWLQPRKDKLEFPGGKIEPYETPVEAAKREIREETGVLIDIEKLQFFKKFDFDINGSFIEIFAFLFEDTMALFPKEGYKSLDLMRNEHIELNLNQNIDILNDLFQYFQEVSLPNMMDKKTGEGV